MKPIVAIVGRPNVGKSTFFNRVTRTQDALVDDFPGVTRDRHYGDAVWDDIAFTLVDTGGFTEGHEFADEIRFQVHQAIADADVIVLLLDGKEGISPFDRDIIELLRVTPKPVFYAVNKIDSAERETHVSEFYSLGVDPLYPISAEHRYGMGDFLDALVDGIATLARPSGLQAADGAIGLAVVGRPNVGKSSLINRILGQERLLVSDRPGTTRDAIIKALRSLDRCDVALIVLDTAEGITEQDISIAGYAYERGCGCVLLLNKWDLVQKDTHTAKEYLAELKMRAKFLAFAPAMTISALTGQRVMKIFKLVDGVYDQYVRRIGTGQLNRILETATTKNPPPLHRGKPIKFYYATQVSSRPPTVVCFVNHPKAVHFSYKRFLINQIREQAGLDKTPIRILFRPRENRKQKGRARKR